MEANKLLLNSFKGKRTALDKAYANHINNLLETLDEEEEARWETYHVILEELIKQGKGDFFNEVKYRITDGEKPANIFLEIINREANEESGLLWFLKRRVEEYKDEDFFKKFYE